MRFLFSAFLAVTALLMTGITAYAEPLHKQFSHVATKPHGELKAFKIDIVRAGTPYAILLTGKVNVKDGIFAGPSKFQNIRDFAYVASLTFNNQQTTSMTPGEVKVGYTLKLDKAEVVKNKGLSVKFDVNLRAFDGQDFVPVEQMKRQFNTFSSEGKTIELPAITDLNTSGTLNIPLRGGTKYVYELNGNVYLLVTPVYK